MHRRQALKVFAGLALCPLCAATSFGAETLHWSYEGATGPDKWGNLDAANGMCSIGSQESPLDIVGPIRARLPPLNILWRKRPDTIVNNGHTIQLNFAEGNTLNVGDRSYALTQFHFHHPSEHLVGGKTFAMEPRRGRWVRGRRRVHRSGQGQCSVQQDRVDDAAGRGLARFGRSCHRSQPIAAGSAGLLPLLGIPDDAAVQ